MEKITFTPPQERAYFTRIVEEYRGKLSMANLRRDVQNYRECLELAKQKVKDVENTDWR